MFFEPDLTDELMHSPALPAKGGVKVKSRSSSCNGRLQGCTFFHSTPLRPGYGLNVSFKDDMDLLNHKIIDIAEKVNKGRQTLGGQHEKAVGDNKPACRLKEQRGEPAEAVNCKENMIVADESTAIIGKKGVHDYGLFIV